MADDGWANWQPETSKAVEGAAAFRARQALSRSGSQPPTAASVSANAALSGKGKQHLTSGSLAFEGPAFTPEATPAPGWGNRGQKRNRSRSRSPARGPPPARRDARDARPGSSARDERNRIGAYESDRRSRHERDSDGPVGGRDRGRDRDERKDDRRDERRDSERERGQNRGRDDHREHPTDRHAPMKREHEKDRISERSQVRESTRERPHEREREIPSRRDRDSERDADRRQVHGQDRATESRRERSRSRDRSERKRNDIANGRTEETKKTLAYSTTGEKVIQSDVPAASPSIPASQPSEQSNSRNGAANAETVAEIVPTPAIPIPEAAKSAPSPAFNLGSIKGAAAPRTILVENLAEGTTEGDIETTFSEFGKITRCKLAANKTSEGNLAFEVTYLVPADASKAIEEMNGINADGKIIRIAHYVPPAASPVAPKVPLAAPAGVDRSLFSRLGIRVNETDDNKSGKVRGKQTNGNASVSDSRDLPSELLSPYTDLLKRAGVDSLSALQSLVRPTSVPQYVELLGNQYPDEKLLKGMTAKWALRERLEEWLGDSQPSKLDWTKRAP